MTNRKLKQLLQEAYALPDSERKAAFLRRIQPRKLNTIQLLCMQLRYSLLSVLLGSILLAAGIFACAIRKDANSAQMLSAFMPVTALMAMTSLGRSERYGMNELEMTTRFSLRLLRMLQLTTAGILSLLIMAVISFAMTQMGEAPCGALLLAGVPYLVTSGLCMRLIRIWHASENIYGCMAIAAVLCVIGLWLSVSHIPVSTGLRICLAGGFGYLTIREARKYINESEELTWSLC